MKRLLWFILLAVVVEAVAITTNNGRWPGWILDVVVVAFVVYLVVLALKGWRKQVCLQLPPALTGKVVRRRHWRLF